MWLESLVRPGSWAQQLWWRGRGRTPSTAPPWLGLGGLPWPADQGRTHPTGVRNLGPEPHKARRPLLPVFVVGCPQQRPLKLPPLPAAWGPAHPLYGLA